MHANPDAHALLSLWENALGQRPAARADALLQTLPGGAGPARTLGEHNVRLVELHAQAFGRGIDLLSHCPTCGTVVQFRADCDALVAQMPVADSAPSYLLEVDGHQIAFRLPDSSDVAAACGETGEAGEQGEDQFVHHLLDRCVLSCTCQGINVTARRLPAPVLDALSQRMEALDPGASVSFDLECPECSARWDSHLDVGQLVWRKVEAAAERLLLDVDSLARAYGWTEPEVLALNPLRRAAYLQMVAA